MYLKKLKMKGFKSFAETAELEFSQGVSAIVGPNGSGKSNITDAIRWVLGEQSTKNLRGKHMEDVIFAGTEQKAPLGCAEVILTLDNSDQALPDAPTEITVARRLFRSGDSDYLLNNKSCKLKDIQRIFSDTGLGKNGYSLISQGGIENIINSSPGELRAIVEEAVGIVNYRTRKQEAERQLGRTRENMDRVRDILDELSQRLKPLKRQAEKAKAYLKIYDELKIVDLYFFTQKIEEIAGAVDAFQGQLKAAEAGIARVTRQIEAQDQRYRRIKAEREELREKLGAAEAEDGRLAAALSTARDAVLVGGERLRHLDGETARIQKELDAQAQLLSKLSAEKQDLSTQRNTLAAENDALDQDAAQLRGDRENLKGQLSVLEDQAARRHQKAEAASARRDDLNRSMQDLREAVSATQARLALMVEQQDGLLGERGSSGHEEETMKTALSGIDARMEETGAELAKRMQDSRALSEEIDSLKDRQTLLTNNMKVNASKCDYLKKIQHNYSDYFPSIQHVMKSAELDDAVRRGIYGPVGELLQVPAQYARAIDVAMGSRSQNIAVATTAIARRCIDLLKAHRAGRATFLPLDNLRFSTLDRRTKEAVCAQQGIRGIASDLVEYDDLYRPVMESLLGRTVVAEDFKTAEGIRKKFPALTLVTLDGEIFYPGGAIVGGATKGGRQSPLYKKVEIENLQGEYAQMRRQQQENAAALDALNARYEGLQQTIEGLVAQKTRLTQESWQKKNGLDLQRERLAKNDQQLKTVADAIADLRGSLAEKDGQINALQRELDALDGGSDGSDAPETGLEALRSQIGTKDAQLAAMQLKLARGRERQRALDEQLAGLNQRVAGGEARLKSLNEESDRSQADHAAQTQSLAAHQQEAAALEEQIAGNTETVERIRKQEKAQNSELESLDLSIRELNHELILLNEEKSKTDIALNRRVSERDHLEETMFARYEVNALMAADQLEAADLSAYELTEARQRALRSQLSALGQINVEAIEEFMEVEKRHDFLKGQYDDLCEAKNELEGIIGDLYKSMEHQFAAGFARLRDIFSTVFTTLFEGGRARIDYTDPEHVLESGIELVAQPPGKNLRQISLLSGGEKSMTAIALLFSFLQLNPSPFCVIDEIDAALDDLNINRFTAYMAQISQYNQFIIITHRKNTLEACDAIYGVSMSKSGISKLVSVRLSDYVEPADTTRQQPAG